MHTNLLINNKGFTTSLLSKNAFSPDQTFEVIIDLVNTRLIIESSYREPLRIALTGQSLNALCDETCSELVDIGVKPPLEKPSFLEGTRGRFDPEPLTKYWAIVTSVLQVMHKIKTEFQGETSPIQLRPDDLSLILTWYGEELNEKSSSSEQQIELGFSTGDDLFEEAFFFIARFPGKQALKERISDKKMSVFTKDNSKFILPYSEVSKTKNSEQTLLNFYKSVLL
jgi:hypothetical protein